MFRGGPAHLGIYQGGGSTLVGLAWRAPTDGDVVSSPTIAGGVVYIGSNDGHVYALDLTSGDRRWRTDLGSQVSSSPAVGGGLIYATAGDGSVHALDATTGARRWRIATRALIRFPWGHESGDYYLSSPTYVNGVLVFGAGDGGVYAVDARSGSTRWRVQTEGRIRGTPAVVDGLVVVGSFDGRVYAIDLASGAVRWRYATEGASLESGNFGFDRRSIQSSPAIANGVVYVGARDGFIYALNAATGVLRWRYDHKVSWINSSPAVSDGVLYAGSSDGQFVQALDTSGKELWRTKTNSLVWSSPAVAGSLVYVGDGVGRLHAIDRQTGVDRWIFRTSASVYSSPVVSGDFVVVGSSDGSVYAVRAGDGAEVQRAVYFDSTLLKLARTNDPATLSRYLGSRGYRALDSISLGTFLRDRVTDRAPSVIVFAVDYLPASVLTSPAAASLLRRYLESGGKVVWIGPPPGIFPLQTPAGQLRLDWSTAAALTAVPQDSALFDRHGVRVTMRGTRWGLPPRWRDAWSVAPGGVTQTLGVDDTGLAAAWVKNFGGAEGTGFVRVPGDDPLAVYLAAEFRGGGAGVKR
jgi:outer membrane protein assembly factor BamB